MCTSIFPSISHIPHFQGYWTGREIPGLPTWEFPPWYLPDNPELQAYEFQLAQVASWGVWLNSMPISDHQSKSKMAAIDLRKSGFPDI